MKNHFLIMLHIFLHSLLFLFVHLHAGFIWQTDHPNMGMLFAAFSGMGGFRGASSMDDIITTKFKSVRNGSTVSTKGRSSKAPKKCELVFDMRGEKASLELTAADGQDQCVSDIKIEEGKNYYFCFFLYSWADNTDVVTIESIKKIEEGAKEEEEEEAGDADENDSKKRKREEEDESESKEEKTEQDKKERTE